MGVALGGGDASWAGKYFFCAVGVVSEVPGF
jgi:hypothetical protein